jgi:hypothetical protein
VVPEEVEIPSVVVEAAAEAEVIEMAVVGVAEVFVTASRAVTVTAGAAADSRTRVAEEVVVAVAEAVVEEVAEEASMAEEVAEVEEFATPTSVGSAIGALSADSRIKRKLRRCLVCFIPPWCLLTLVIPCFTLVRLTLRTCRQPIA